jgi:hypothetical protein
MKDKNYYWNHEIGMYAKYLSNNVISSSIDVVPFSSLWGIDFLV